MLRLRWIREAIRSPLPVAQVGGDIARSRVATRLGVSGASAQATVAVDFALGLVTPLLYTLIEVGLRFRRDCLRQRSASGFDGAAAWPGWPGIRSNRGGRVWTGRAGGRERRWGFRRRVRRYEPAR